MSEQARPNDLRPRVPTGTCDAHGPYFGPCRGCPTCEREADREARADARRRAWFDASGLVGRNAEATIGGYAVEDPKQAAAVAATQHVLDAMVRGDGAGAMLVGLPGTGKTHLLAATVRAAIFDHNKVALYTTQRQLIRVIRDTWRREAEQSEAEVIERYAGADLLALDELGLTSTSENEAALLFDVLDGRYARRLPTLIASNLPPKQLQAAIGDRLWDRLQEGARIVPCTWPSHRRPKP